MSDRLKELDLKYLIISIKNTSLITSYLFKVNWALSHISLKTLLDRTFLGQRLAMTVTAQPSLAFILPPSPVRQRPFITLSSTNRFAGFFNWSFCQCPSLSNWNKNDLLKHKPHYFNPWLKSPRLLSSLQHRCAPWECLSNAFCPGPCLGVQLIPHLSWLATPSQRTVHQGQPCLLPWLAWRRLFSFP